jgi:hypothetical protein
MCFKGAESHLDCLHSIFQCHSPPWALQLTATVISASIGLRRRFLSHVCRSRLHLEHSIGSPNAPTAKGNTLDRGEIISLVMQDRGPSPQGLPKRSFSHRIY